MNLKVYQRSTFLIFLISIAFQSLSAATRVSQASGSWNSAATWGGTVPVANDDIVISTGTIVSLNSSLPSSSSFGNVIINEGGTLVVGVNGVTFRIKGSLSNDGVINFWQSATFQADIMLYGNSIWSGSGSWNLSTINVQNNSLEVADGMSLTINTSFTAYAGASFNKLNRHLNTTLYIKGTINSMISSFPDFYYGHLVISKTAGTVSFSPSNSSNVINLSGDLTLVNPTDRLIVEANNTLSLQGRATGAGVISGSTTSSLIVDNIEAPAINPLRILSGTSFKELIVNRRAGVTLSSGFIIRENLRLNNSCLLTLPPNTLTLGVNGTNPTAGSLSGNGRFVGSSNSSISIRGKDTTSVILRFDQGTLASHTLNNLIIDKQAGKAGIENGNLLLTGKLDISDKNIFSIGAGTLIIRIVPVFIGNGCLSGSKNASLRVEGITQSGYPLRFDQSTPLGNILKSYTQSRNATITLANKLNITEEVSLTGNASVLVSNGNLTLLSSPAGNACISPLLNNADVQGDVNVQVYISGDGQSMKFRGYRSLSSPLNDDQIVAGQKRSLGQLKDHIIVTGPGGIANGFDQGGNAQPFAQTLTFYNPLAVPGSSLFTPVATIYESLKPGTGFLAFYRGAQQGSYALNYNKLNSPYSPPEAATVVYKGPINKYVLPSITLRTNKDTTDSHRGYNLIGNPYPSAIDWAKVSKSPGVNDEVVVLKPGGGTATYLNGVS
jgi:hypothetical protein